jgi:hypothetical protein
MTMSPSEEEQKRNFGYVLEMAAYDALVSSNLFDNVYTELDLRKMFGWGASSVDLMLVKGDMVIMGQLKWRRSRRRESIEINKFIKSVNHICSFLDQGIFVFGIWISRMEPFNDNKERMLREHKIYSDATNSKKSKMP